MLRSVIKARPEVEFQARLQMSTGWQEIGFGFSFETSTHPVKIRKAVSNLKRLEIVESRLNEWAVRDDLNDLENKFREQFAGFVTAINASDEAKRTMRIEGNVHLLVVRTGLYLTPLGTDFANICLSS